MECMALSSARITPPRCKTCLFPPSGVVKQKLTLQCEQRYANTALANCGLNKPLYDRHQRI